MDDKLWEDRSSVAVIDCLSLAIARGAPAYNQGDVLGCAETYLKAARSVLDQAHGRRQSLWAKVGALRDVVARFEVLSSGNADDAAWALRSAFDTILGCYVDECAVDVRRAVDGLLKRDGEDRTEAARQALVLTIAFGSRAYNLGFEARCAQAYSGAAARLLDAEWQRGDAVDRVLRDHLAPILLQFETVGLVGEHRFRWAVENQGSEFSWSLRKGFDSVLSGLDLAPLNLAAADPSARGSEVRPNSVFLSYARSDLQYVNELLLHMRPLLRQDDLVAWSDRQVLPGERWHDIIQEHLESAAAAVLLISPAFLASDYIAGSELPVLLRRAEADGLRILPILVRPSALDMAEFKYPDPIHGPESFTLDRLQSVNEPERTLQEMSDAERNRVFMRVVDQLMQWRTGFG